MLAELARIDPASAARLHANDKKRIIRALEVYGLSGRTISQHDEETRRLPARYNASTIALTFADRATLYARIDRRVDAMLEMGFEDEVRALLKMDIAPDCTAMQAIGYKEMVGAIRGEYSIGVAADHIKLHSRQYAKRQLTWLRRNESIRWIAWDKEPDFEQISGLGFGRT